MQARLGDWLSFGYRPLGNSSLSEGTISSGGDGNEHRAIAAKPSIILADEPTGALDSVTGRKIMDIFHKLHEEQGKTIVLITHSQELAQETERIVTLLDGQIVADNGGEH